MARGEKKEELSLDEKLKQALVAVEEQPYEVPENWCWVKNYVVCKLGDGEEIDGREYPYLEVKYLRGTNAPRIINKGKYIGKGTKVILVDGENSGEVFEVSEDGYMGSTFKTLNISPKLDEKYLLYFAESKRELLRNSKTGSAIPHLNKKLFFSLEFPLPPLLEQQRIVERVESLFAKLDEVKEKVQYILDSFENRKASILYKAFQGALTEKWRKKEDINILDWKQRTIKDVCNDIKVGIVIKPTQYYTEPDNGVAAFRSANVREAYIEDENWVYINQIGRQENKRSEVHTGDVLIVRSGNPGTACVVTEEYDGFNAIDIIIAVPDKSQIDSKYLCYYTNSPEGKGLVRENKRGMALPHFNVGGYSKLPIKVPSLEEQHEIVRIIEMEMSKEQKAKEIVQSIVDEIDVMKKAILAKAFRGELGTNNPDEESAIELLKEILMEF